MPSLGRTIPSKWVLRGAVAIVGMIWVGFALTFLHWVSYPATLLAVTNGDVWEFSWLFTIYTLAVVPIDRYKLESEIKPFVLFFISSIILVELSSHFPLGQTQYAYVVLTVFCRTTCVPVALDYLGGIAPLALGLLGLLLASRLFPASLKRNGAFAVTAGVISFLLVSFFHKPGVTGTTTDFTVFFLSGLPTFFAVEHILSNRGGLNSLHVATRNQFAFGALLVYCMTACAYFFADIEGLFFQIPTILAENINSLPLVIGGAGTKDANFLYPLAFAIAFLITESARAVITKVRGLPKVQ